MRLNALKDVADPDGWWVWLLGLSVLVVAVLVGQKRALVEEIRDVRRAAMFPAVGEYVPEFTTETLDGTALRIGSPPDGTTQGLLVFSTTCGSCLVTLPV